MIWGFALWLACTNVGKIPSKSDIWLEDHLRSSTSIEHQLVMIEEMGVRRNPNSVTLLVQKASSSETEFAKPVSKRSLHTDRTLLMIDETNSIWRV